MVWACPGLGSRDGEIVLRFDGLKRKHENLYLSKLERSNRIGLEKKERGGRNGAEVFLKVWSMGLWKRILAEQTNGVMELCHYRTCGDMM